MNAIAESIAELAKAHREAGGHPEGALMAPTSFAILKRELSIVPHSTMEPGGHITVLTDYGDIKVLLSPYCPPDKIYVADIETLRRMARETAALYEGML